MEQNLLNCLETISVRSVLVPTQVTVRTTSYSGRTLLQGELLYLKPGHLGISGVQEKMDPSLKAAYCPSGPLPTKEDSGIKGPDTQPLKPQTSSQCLGPSHKMVKMMMTMLLGLSHGALCTCMHTHSVTSDSVTPRTVARQAPLSVGFSRREHRSGLPRPPPGDSPDSGT